MRAPSDPLDVRLLIVSEAYAPTRHAEAFCTTRFAQALAALGVEVVVLTRAGSHLRKTPVDPSPRWAREDGVRVVRLGARGRLARSAGDALAALVAGGTGIKGWHRAALSAALAEHAARPFDLVTTRHVSERTAWVGERLRRVGVPWVAHFADPAPACLHLPPYGPGGVRSGADRRAVAALRRLLAAADAVAWPCERLARFHQRALGIEVPRAIVVPHVGGVDDLVPAAPPRAPTAPAEVRVLHAGLWLDGRFPGPLLLGVADAAAHAAARGARLVVEVSGPTQEGLEPRLPAGARGAFRFPGLTAYDASLAAMRAADALLLSEVPLAEGVFLPTKLADYATARRPVLAHSPRVGTVADRLGAGHPGLLGQDREGVCRGLVRLVDAVLDADAAALAAFHVPRPEDFLGPTVAARFLRDVAAIVRRRPPRAA